MRKLLFVEGGLHAALGGDALVQLVERQREATAAALFSVCGLPAVKGEVSRDLSEKSGKHGGALGRHGVPCIEPCVADAFLGVLVYFQDVSRNGAAVAAVFPFRLRERLLFAGPVEIDDPIVLQSGASYLSERFFLRLVAAGLIFF